MRAPIAAAGEERERRSLWKPVGQREHCGTVLPAVLPGDADRCQISSMAHTKHGTIQPPGTTSTSTGAATSSTSHCWLINDQ